MEVKETNKTINHNYIVIISENNCDETIKRLNRNNYTGTQGLNDGTAQNYFFIVFNAIMAVTVLLLLLLLLLWLLFIYVYQSWECQSEKQMEIMILSFCCYSQNTLQVQKAEFS